MKTIFTVAILSVCLILPFGASAHGIVQDEHDEPLRAIDYIELAGISLGSLGMIIYSFDQWRKDKKKKNK